MSEETIDVTALEGSESPDRVRVPCLRSAIRFAWERGYVVADPAPLPPPEPEKVAIPKGVGGRNDPTPGPKVVPW
jgi:hypothetical protein